MRTHGARIARSGVQYYLDNELPGLMVGAVPREYRGQRVFAVYRPSFVLESAKDKFAGVPVRVGHQWVHGESDPSIIGRVSDDVKITRHGEEVALCASLDLDDGKLEKGRELSPGYLSDNRWIAGVSPDGIPYEILCTGINEVNHLAVVDEARGGKDMKMLDGGRLMVHSGLIHSIRKRIMGVFDGKVEDTFENVVDKISETLDNGGEGIDAMASSLSEKCGTLPDSEEKDKLLRYVADIPLLVNEEKAVRDEALSCIKESYSSLESDAVADSTEKPMTEEEKKAAEAKAAEGQKTEEKKPDAAPADANPPTETKAADAAPADGGAPTNAPANASVEEKHGAEEHATLVDAINKMSERLDKVLSSIEGKVADEKEVKETEKEVEVKDGCAPAGVSDAMPQYTQTLGAVNAGYSLDDAFAKLKGRR